MITQKEFIALTDNEVHMMFRTSPEKLIDTIRNSYYNKGTALSQINPETYSKIITSRTVNDFESRFQCFLTEASRLDRNHTSLTLVYENIYRTRSVIYETDTKRMIMLSKLFTDKKAVIANTNLEFSMTCLDLETSGEKIKILSDKKLICGDKYRIKIFSERA